MGGVGVIACALVAASYYGSFAINPLVFILEEENPGELAGYPILFRVFVGAFLSFFMVKPKAAAYLFTILWIGNAVMEYVVPEPLFAGITFIVLMEQLWSVQFREPENKKGASIPATKAKTLQREKNRKEAVENESETPDTPKSPSPGRKRPFLPKNPVVGSPIVEKAKDSFRLEMERRTQERINALKNRR